MQSRARKTWFSIAIAAVILIAVVVVALAGGGFYFARHYVSAVPMGQFDSDGELDRIAARFSGQTPLLEQQGDEIVVNRHPERPRQEIRALHLLTYDPTDGRMLNFTVPGWLLQWLPNSKDSSIALATDKNRRPRRAEFDEFDPSLPRQLKLDDLERHGPGLVFDGRESHNGNRVLIWSE
jgi:hypothetical protein